MEIVRNEPLYQQAAKVLRQAIADGEYPPGGMLPSEAELSRRYKISRPTVRQAIASLRSEGLVDVVMGKGSFVRATAPAHAVGIKRRVTKAGAKYATPQDDWPEAEAPAVYRADTDSVTAPLLGLVEEEAVITVDRTLIHPQHGDRILHRVIIPLATAEGTALIDDPARPVAELYSILAEGGRKLEWSETVRARMPHPDERTALGLPEAVPLLLSYRVTRDAANGRPLILEELRARADGTALHYLITAETPRNGPRSV
ncbi:GntR family transcriptional regulator [Phaeacidiphilus oryzae]|uniref:GntR family transcriptional regulator n=1 Tax=Phaeacidiphilus oryzae TaxID=348818 RepID=UPI00055AEEBA|nr:GntR family transcriptional regulator [Phaeacidiphilus oryzae]